jgi:hypothetical protein
VNAFEPVRTGPNAVICRHVKTVFHAFDRDGVAFHRCGYYYVQHRAANSGMIHGLFMSVPAQSGLGYLRIMGFMTILVKSRANSIPDLQQKLET